MNKVIHVADSSREELREPIRWFFPTRADLIAEPVGAPPDQYRFYRRVRENLLSLTDEKALDHSRVLKSMRLFGEKVIPGVA